MIFGAAQGCEARDGVRVQPWRRKLQIRTETPESLVLNIELHLHASCLPPDIKLGQWDLLRVVLRDSTVSPIATCPRAWRVEQAATHHLEEHVQREQGRRAAAEASLAAMRVRSSLPPNHPGLRR